MGKFVDIHTHKSKSAHPELMNHPVQDQWKPEKDKLYSIGLHPWHIDKFDINDLIEILAILVNQANVLAIGECGLDRSINIPIEKQEEAFIKQIEVAEAIHKPLIIHSVRSYSDLIRIKKSRKSDIPWILHAYNGNRQITEQLLAHQFYFSFGAALLRNNAKLINSLQLIPLNKLFFETDESSVQIETIYIFAAKQLQLSFDELKAGIYKNFKLVFSHG